MWSQFYLKKYGWRDILEAKRNNFYLYIWKAPLHEMQLKLLHMTEYIYIYIYKQSFGSTIFGELFHWSRCNAFWDWMLH